MKQDDEDNTSYVVVKNHEDQYSLIPEYRDVPAGWSTVGPKGPKHFCLEYIQKVWTDMRPLSVRKKTDGEVSTTP